MSKKTLVLGASLKEQRYSNKAIHALREKEHEVIALGLREGLVLDVDIQKEKFRYKFVDTVTVYLNEKNQEEYEEYILGLKPKRIIFNPGAENPAFSIKASKAGIETMNACTLVMLSTGQY